MPDNKPNKLEKLKSGYYLLGRGAISGAIAVFVLLATFWLLIFPLTGFWHFDNSGASERLIAALLGSIIPGLPAGGIGGLIIGSIWERYAHAPIVGGITFALGSLTTLFSLIPCLFWGGC